MYCVIMLKSDKDGAIMQVKLVITDLDRTFLREDKTVSSYAISVIEEMRRRGILFMIATARPEIAVKQFIPSLSFDYAVYHNGALVDFCNGHVLHYGISSEIAMQICQSLLKSYPEEKIAIEMDNMRYTNFPATDIWPGVDFEYTDFTDLPKKTAEKILIPMSGEYHHKFQGFLPDDLYIQISESTLCMIMNRKAHKLTGIQSICEKVGIKLDEAVAFGDDLNDIDMLKACGIGVAVSNALDEVKSAATEICGSNAEDGVAKWIESHLL